MTDGIDYALLPTVEMLEQFRRHQLLPLASQEVVSISNQHGHGPVLYRDDLLS